MLDCRIESLSEKRDEARYTRARREALVRNQRFRVPHHSCSLQALLSELCLAAGGVLYLDYAHEIQRVHLRAVLRTVAAMEASCRPLVILSCSDEMLDQVRELVDEVRSHPIINAAVPS